MVCLKEIFNLALRDYFCLQEMHLAKKLGRSKAVSCCRALYWDVSGEYMQVPLSRLVIYFFLTPTECEHLIRRMLVLDPTRRLTIAQIKEHKWMLIEVPAQRPILYPPGEENEPSLGEYNEQVLRLMHSLGIDQQKTIEVK